MMVKICGITNQDDAQAAADAGASALGFNFWRDSPRYISPTGASLITEKLPAGILKVGVFVDEAPDVIAKIALQAGLDIAQLHGDAECPALRRWRARPIREPFEFDCFKADPDVEAFLLDTASTELRGGTGQTFRWSLAKLAKSMGKPIVIAGGLDETNVQTAIEEARPWGVDACSRLENSPGRKDLDKMQKFIRAALAS